MTDRKKVEIAAKGARSLGLNKDQVDIVKAACLLKMPMGVKWCRICRLAFLVGRTQRRKDAEYCSNACRQFAYRIRKKK